MSKVASAAATLGVGEDQLAAQLSTIISVTRQAPETVGTALRTVYARITDIKAGLDEDGVTLGKYSGDMAKIGINVLDLNGNLRNMGEVMEEIGNKWSTMTQEQKIYLAQTMAGQRQYSNLMALFDNFDKYESALNTAQNAEGKLQEQQDIYMDRLSTHVQQLTTATEHMWMGLVDTDGFKDIIDGLTTIVEKVDKLFQSIGGGKNLLQSLVPIVMSLTSKTVASGINTMIMNSQLEKRQLRDQRSSQALAQKEMKDLQREGQQGSQRYQIFKQESEFLQAAPGTFSTQQMDEINKRWSGSLEAAAEADKRKTELNQYSDITRSITTTLGNNAVDLKETLSIEDLENAIIDVGGQYDELSIRIKRYAQDQDEISKQQEAAQQQLTEAYLQIATKIKSATVFPEENPQFKQFNIKNLRKYESTQAQIISQEQQKLDSLPELSDKKKHIINTSALTGMFNIMQNRKKGGPTSGQISAIEKVKGFEEIQDIEGREGKIKKIREILENSIYQEIFKQMPKTKNADDFRKAVQDRFAEIEQNAKKAIQQASKKQKAANQELLRRQQMTNTYQQNFQALKGNLQIQNVDKFQNNLQFLSQDFSSMAIPPELKTQVISIKKEYQELSQEIIKYNEKIQSSSELSQEQIDALRQEKKALEEKQQALLDTTQGTIDSINADVQDKGQQAIDELKYSKTIGNNNRGAIGDIQDDADRQKQLQGIMSTLAGVNMLTAAFSNLGNAIRGAFYEGNWEGFVEAILTSTPMLISSLAQISDGWTKISSLMDIQIGKSAKVVAAKTAENASSVANTAANMAQKAAKQASAKAAQHQAAANGEAAAADVVQGEASVVNAEKNVGEAGAKGSRGIFKLGESFKVLGSMLKKLLPLLAIYAAYKTITFLGDLQVNYANEIVEANKKIIDSENEKQEQLKKQEDVIKEVEELNKQYKQGSITKTELKEKTEQLQQKYKDQSDEIQQLIKDYKHLGEAAKEAKKKQAEQLEKSTKEEFTASASTLDKKMSTMHVREGLESWRGTQSARWAGQASIGGGLGDKGYAASTLGKMLENEGLGGYSGLDNVIHLNNARNDQEAFQQLQILQKFVDNVTEEQKESDAYKGAQEILDAMKQDIENYKNATEQHFDALGKKIATQADIDFNKFDNLNDFSVEYKALAEDMRANFKAEHPGKTEEEIEEEVSKAMKEAIGPEAYEKFGEKQQVLNKLDKNTNLGEIPNDVKSMIDALDSDQLDAFLHMDLENVESYDSIKQALQKISQLDFSNVDGLTEANLNAAIESYNKLQQILEAVQKGKKLSKKAIQEESGLTKEEIEEWFNQDVGGNYTVKAGKTQAEVEEFLKQKSVEKYRDVYRGTQKTIESNQAFLDAQKNDIVGSSDWQNINVEKDLNFSFSKAFVEHWENEEKDKSESERRYWIENFIKSQEQAYKEAEKKNDYSKIHIGKDQLLNLQNELKRTKSTIDGQAVNAWKNIEYNLNHINSEDITDDMNSKIKAINTKYESDKETGQNNQKKNKDNAKAMLDLIQQIDPTKTDFVKNSVYREHAQSGNLTEEEFNKIVEEYQKLVDKYKNANEDLQKAQEESKEELSKIHEGLFTIDDDVDETLVVKLGQQFQLTAKKSKLLDDALKSNAKKAKDVAEEVQRYNAALSSVIKNYAIWQDKLSGSTADKLSVAPQIKDAMADTLGISESTLSDTFATTKQNFEDMRLALEGDEKAYERLQQAAYEDILIHIGLDDADLNEIKTDLSTYVDEEDLTKIKVGAELDDQELNKILAKLIAKGVETEQQLEAIFASFGIDLDVVLEDGKIQMASYTKAATYELKEQQKSQEELKNLERDRIKNQKELTKFLKDERDIYHQINKLLSDQERAIKRITRNQQDMYGTELLDNLNAESAEYEKQQKLLKSKQKLQQQDLANKKAELASKGASFDANGNISNYNNLIGSAINNVNSIISRERGIQEAMNQHLLSGGNTSDEIYKDLDAQLSSIGREKSQANDYLNDLKTDLSNYEKVKDQAEDVADQLTELSEKQIEINLKKFNMKLEITLDLSQATKTWNDYKRNVLQHDDIFNPNKTLSAQKDNAQRLADIDADSRSLNQVNQQIAAAMADNGNLYKTQGQKKKAIEELQKKAIQLRKGILENEDAIKQTYLEQYDIISEMFEKQKSQYEFVNNQLEHNKNMMSLVYGENNYAAQNIYNDKMIENNLKSIESMNNRVKIAEENLQKARKSGNTAVIEAAEQEWQTAIQNRNQLEEQSAQLLKDRYTTAINQIAHQMEQKLTNGKGFNYLDTQWDLMKKQSNLYLDDVNSAFAVKNTEYLYNQALNDTKGLKSQQQLKKVMSEQLDILKEKDKLTQYDVDRAQKVLEVEKARIALEQARNNKTQMRLKRDSQGNYSYQYVADQDNIAKAENDLQKVENDLYNFDKENYENKLKEAYDATKEYQEKITALEIEYAIATEERRKQIDEEKRLLDQQYSEYILNLSQETEWGKQNLMESTMMNFTDMMNQEQLDFENMSDAQKAKWLGDMVPSINSGIAEMIGKFSTNPDSFKQIVIEATQAMDNERKTYQQGLAELQKAAGENWNNIKQAMDPVVELQNKLITDNDRLKDQAGEIVDAMNGTLDALGTQAKKWETVYNKTDAAVKRVYDYIEAIDKAAKKKLDQDSSSGGGGEDSNIEIPTVDDLKTFFDNAAPGNVNSGGNEIKTSLGRDKDIDKDKKLQYLERQFKIIKENTKGIYYDGTPETEKLKDKYAYDYTVVASKRGMGFAANLVDLAKDFKYWAQHAGLAKDTKDTALRYGADKNFISILSEMTGVKFDTGGYTGDWSSTQGKLAVLHQKELVLNKEDTANMLKAIQMVREMQQNELKMRMTQLNNEIQDIIKQSAQIEKIKAQQELLEQSVTISASFPSVNSKKEIEQALTELVNKATQKTMRYKNNL